MCPVLCIVLMMLNGRIQGLLSDFICKVFIAIECCYVFVAVKVLTRLIQYDLVLNRR